MSLEWDDLKNQGNKAKHGLGFEQMSDFDWSLAHGPIIHDVAGEERELWIGPIVPNLVAVVITIRGPVTRIISLRQATRQEITLWKKDFYDG